MASVGSACRTRGIDAATLLSAPYDDDRMLGGIYGNGDGAAADDAATFSSAAGDGSDDDNTAAPADVRPFADNGDATAAIMIGNGTMGVRGPDDVAVVGAAGVMDSAAAMGSSIIKGADCPLAVT